MSIEIHLREQRGELSLDVDLSISSQGVTALFGPSGAGKTTLLRVIAGLEKLDSAKVSLDQAQWQTEDLFIPTHERNIAYVFQEPSLFPHLNVGGNLDYALDRAVVNSKLKLEELTELLGIQKLLSRSIQTLSGGEQQRVAIARALASNPKLLLMDEPLAAVDQNRRNEILPFIENLHQALDLPVIYVSHSSDEIARIADHIVLMDKGRTTASGPVRDILTRLDLPLAQRNDAETILLATPIEFDASNQINTLRVGNELLLVPGEEIKTARQVRVRIAARDISITLARQENTSILNILPASISAIQEVDAAQVLISLNFAEQTLLARLTRLSAKRLNLEIGQPVYIQVKSIAVLN